jgi:hypothetical protein
VYHTRCFETGRPSSFISAKNAYACTPKLPPSFCAKYLPLQIIIKLVLHQDSSLPLPSSLPLTKRTIKRKKINENAVALTTLYFVWKERETRAEQLRKETKDAPMVQVPFSLDEQAPANPNYIPQNGFYKKQKNSEQRRKPLQVLKHKLRDVQMELVTPGGEEVAPRCPVMPEPVSIINNINNNCSSLRVSDDDCMKAGEEVLQQDTPTPITRMTTSVITTSESFLCAKLEYLKFGLQYTLTLNIPCSACNDGSGGSDGQQLEQEQAEKEQLKLELEVASLTVTIEDQDRNLD